MPVRVRRDQSWHAAAVATIGPAFERVTNSVGDLRSLCAGVEQQRLISAEDQIKKWLLIIRASRLAEDVEIGVVLVQPEVRCRGARFAGLGPADRERAALETSAVGLRRLCSGSGECAEGTRRAANN